MAQRQPSLRVLVTGATGSVGGRLLPALLERGHEVRAMVRDPSRSGLPDGVQAMRGDVLDAPTLARPVEGQPAAIRDVVGVPARPADLEAPPGEVQVGGADVLSYREMLRRYARLAGRRQPIMVPAPVLSPRLSSYRVGFVTPVEVSLARPLVQGLATEMPVREPPPPGLGDDPLSFDDAVRAALR